MQLNHLHLHVRDKAQAQQFYEAWFGFREHVRHGDILFLRDDAGLDLALAPDASPAPLPPWFHFGFRLASSDDVTALHASMQEQGVTILSPLKQWDDLVVFRCADPDGYAIEVYWE